MKQPKRTSNELKISLAILQMNLRAVASHHRIISSAELIFCWRNSPRDTLVEVLGARIRGKRAKSRFEALKGKVEHISLAQRAVIAEDFLSDRVHRGVSIPSIIKHRDYKDAISNAVVIPEQIFPPMMERQACKASPGHSVEVIYSRAPAKQVYTTYPIFYGTDRLRENSRTVKFCGFRSDDTIAYGRAEVSVPHIHREGKLERPWWRPSRVKGNPNKHIVIHDNELMSLDAWLANAKIHLGDFGDFGDFGGCQGSPQKEGLVFIHGFNVSFDAALWRTAQLCHDLRFPGMMLCFSWASLGTLGGYPADEATVEWSAGNLRRYLEQVTEQLGLSALHIVAHSMGNRALLSVLENWIHKPGATPIHQVIMAAPDVDASRFKQLGRVFNTYEQVTLYASRNDRAIAASRAVHCYPRAGDANPPLVMNDLSTVDVSGAGKDMFGLGHTYMAGVSKVFRDLFYIIRHRHKPDQRAGIIKRDEGYWELT